MKRTIYFALAFLLIQGSSSFAQDDRGGRGGEGGNNYGNSGGHNNGGKARKGNKSNNKNRQPRANNNRGGGGYNNNNNRNYSNNNRNYTNRGNQNYGQNGRSNQRITGSAQLRSMGVHSFPHPFTNRSQMMMTDQAHSTINFPHEGLGGVALHASVYNRTYLSSPAIRAHMNLVMGAGFNRTVVNFNVTENMPGRYYWHAYNGFNYCHYYYGGYHWYGWYFGNSYFWTRYWGNHFWWYDPVYFRWCYWWDGGWWWQDPYHINVVYVYDNGNYVSTSAGAGVNVAVEGNPSAPGARVFNSPDGSRMIKVTGSAQDAFLYDTSSSPSFQPIYLASGVKDVKISNTTNGRPLQVMLILNDGSFDLFDNQGNPYNGNGAPPVNGAESNYNPPPSDNGGNPPPADNGGGNVPPGDNGGNPPTGNGGNAPPADNGGNPPADNGGNAPPAGGNPPPAPAGT